MGHFVIQSYIRSKKASNLLSVIVLMRGHSYAYMYNSQNKIL